MTSEYFEISEQLYADWLAGHSRCGQLVRQTFTLQHAPEPYLRFGSGDPAIVFLSTNPGVGFEFQERPERSPSSLFAKATSYDVAARTAGEFYIGPESPINANSISNIRAMLRIGNALGFRSVLQVEALPWHSAKLNNKRRTLDCLLREDPVVADYLRALQSFLAAQPTVLGWSAGIPASRAGEGVELKARLLNIDLQNCQLTVLENTSEVSQALLWQAAGTSFRGLFVNRGAANLPKRHSRSGQDKDLLLQQLIAEAANSTPQP